ncbi:MAG TPA: alkaline phosphatase family protein [Candidatus Eisenbacteria bacterium]|nr:alkaline phosphatase family protein [Candidatus Eisenbacteria bacterium]
MIPCRFARSVLAALVFVCLAASTFAQVPVSQHVVLVIDENSSFNDVMEDMPWLVGQGNTYGYANNYHSDNGGSLFDYLWLASGSCHSAANCTLPPGTHDFGCSGNSCTSPITDDNIFRELNNAGISWKVYAQSYAAAGGKPTTPDKANGTDYYRRHNGATWYSDILSNVDGSASKIVDLSQLMTDVDNNALPRYVIIVPDGHHDAHDCPVGMPTCTEAQQLAAADQFLSANLQPILNMRDFQAGGTGLIIVTFDECAGGTNQGCGASVYTAVLGPQVKPHTVSGTYYKHENALRTMLDSLGIKNYPGASATAADMSDFFHVNTNKPQVIMSSPVNGANMGSPVLVQASATPSIGNHITGWVVYVDGKNLYGAGAVTAIDANIAMSNGNHTVIARAWDSSGNFGDQTVNISVNASKPSVSISTPGNNSNVGSPMNLQASATPSSGQRISGWWVYVDSVGKYNTGSVNSINTNLTLTPGWHNIVVRAWDTSDDYGDQTIAVNATTSKTAVTVSSPAPGSNVSSPIALRASATPISGKTIVGWWVYLDSKGVYNAGAVNSISPNIGASPGNHTLVVRAWDSSGGYGDQTVPVTVKQGGVSVNITSPANGSSDNSPVNVKANASSSNAIKGWEIYVDSVPTFNQGGGNQINHSLSLKPGTHALMVRAWDTSNAFGDQTVKITVP